jgi:CRP-like cAMP-binding protein
MSDNYANLLDTILASYSPMNALAVNLIWENGNLEFYKKNELIFSERKYNAFEYFQLEGIAHRYNTDADQQLLTTGLYVNDTVITPHFARTTNGQSIFSLQALTDSTYLKVPIGTFDELRASNQAIRAFGQRVVEKEFTRSLSYEVLFRSYTAKERLVYFRRNFPGLENRIPHTVIASFLGITPVSFSRLRAEVAKEGS